LDGFESQTSQTSSQFFPIPSNPCVLGITEQALNVVSKGISKRFVLWVRFLSKEIHFIHIFLGVPNHILVLDL
jgi:hypothetical protein